MSQLVEVNGQTIEFPDGMPMGDIEAAIRKNFLSIPKAKPASMAAKASESPSLFDVAINAGNKGFAAIPDNILNTPNRLLNLGKAALGTVITAAGRPDLAPDLTPDREYAGAVLRKMGGIRESAEPTTSGGRLLDAAIQGGIGSVVSPAGSYGALAGNAGLGALMGGVGESVGDATGNDVLGMTAGMMAPSSAIRIPRAARSAKATVVAPPGESLANALGLEGVELTNTIKALQAAPASIVDGSNLTVNQALQHQGAITPGTKMLERTLAAAPGGDALLKRYAEQAAARRAALENNGAQTYQGAPAEEGTITGDKIGAMLRTQAGDERAANREMWDGRNGVYANAARDGIALHLPIDAMQAAMKPVGRGSTLAATDAKRTLSLATDIGTLELPAIDQIPESRVTSQTLEQAVRAAGGIRGNSGELRDLGIKQMGTTGMINNKSGQSADLLATEMHRRGFIPDADPATLFEALRNKGGRKIYSSESADENGMQRMAEQFMGDAPEASRIPIAAPWEEFQRLRRDSGAAAAKLSDRAGNEVEAGILTKFQKLMAGRVDDAAAGNLLPGEVMTPEFAAQYQSARDATKAWHERYSGGNNISQILRQPVGQNYTLNGTEIANKLWHGGAGLAGDVQNLKQVLSGDNYDPAMNALRRYIMTDAAGKTTASGDLGAAFPRYVENRMPGLLEVMSPDQMGALSGVAKDIRNQDAASAVKGLLGSDTMAKITRALDAGLLDSPLAKSISRIKGLGMVRDKAAVMVIEHKGKTLSELMANPKAAAAALKDEEFRRSVPASTLNELQGVVAGASMGLLNQIND